MSNAGVSVHWTKETVAAGNFTFMRCSTVSVAYCANSSAILMQGCLGTLRISRSTMQSAGTTFGLLPPSTLPTLIQE